MENMPNEAGNDREGSSGQTQRIGRMRLLLWFLALVLGYFTIYFIVQMDRTGKDLRGCSTAARN